MTTESVSKNRPAAGVRRPSGAEEGEAACRGRRGGGSASPTIKEAQSLSNSCSGFEPAAAQDLRRDFRGDPLEPAGVHVAEVHVDIGGSLDPLRQVDQSRAGALRPA